MKLEVCTWKRFALQSLFDIRKGKRLTAEDQTEGNTLYIGAIDSNNGVAAHIGQDPIHFGNTISLSYNGSVGEAFYQEEPYWATDDVNALYCKYGGFNKWIALFIVTVLRQEKYRFSYGRKWTLENMKNTHIKLPIKITDTGIPYIDHILNYSSEGYVPDWQFMEDYVKSLHCKPITTQNTTLDQKLSVDNWEVFKIQDLFTVALSRGDIKADEMPNGQTLLVSSGESDNGIIKYIDSEGDGIAEMFQGNCLTVDMFCNCFYQPEEFYSVSHGRVNILLPKFSLNQYIGLFVSTIINRERYRFSYGRAVYSNVVADMYIMLPIKRNVDGTSFIDKTKKYSSEGYVPDWQFMEDYIKHLPYGDRI